MARKETIMSEIVFEIANVVVMLVTIGVCAYLIPWVKQMLGAERLKEVEKWVTAAVLATQQTCSAKTGAERKEIVTEILRTFLIEKNISISDSQLDVLIEAAVKSMKIAESK